MENLSKHNKTNQPHHPIQAENNPPTPIIPNNTRQDQNYVSNKQDHEPDRNRNSTTKKILPGKKKSELITVKLLTEPRRAEILSTDWIW